MKGIILAGGEGNRMRPATKETNKHLIPFAIEGHGAYPMILFPILNLKQAGIREIILVTGRSHGGRFYDFLGSGKEFGVDLTYKIQDEAGGIAEALSLCESIIAPGEKVIVHLGDNILQDDLTPVTEKFNSLEAGALVCVKKVSYEYAKSLGVAILDEEAGKVKKVIEKSDDPPSQDAVVGIYLYDSRVFSAIAKQTPSARNELEITDTNNWYAEQGEGQLYFHRLQGWWQDAGTPPAFRKAERLIGETPDIRQKLKLLFA
jgi:glucose-1-phosphate thymidylyltransferase